MLDIKSEKYFKNHLKNVPDKQLLKYYQDVEWTCFPVLVMEEYQKRFNPKNKREFLEKLKVQSVLERIKENELSKLASLNGEKTGKRLKMQASHAKKTSSRLRKMAIKRGAEISKDLRNLTRQSIVDGVTSARRMTSSPETNIKLLEKLGKLKKTGVITNTEFQKKKKEILSRI